MPQVNGTTILGSQLNQTLPSTSLTALVLWFPRPLIPALMWQKVGVLRLVQTNTAQLIQVYKWDVVYPGIWPVYLATLPNNQLQAVFDCYRPGLSYSFFWG